MTDARFPLRALKLSGPCFETLLRVLWAAGLFDKEIARALGGSATNAARVRRRLGLEAGALSMLRRRDGQVRELRGKGLTDPEIARRLGITAREARGARQRMGLKASAQGVRRAQQRSGRDSTEHLVVLPRIAGARIGWPGLPPGPAAVLKALEAVGGAATGAALREGAAMVLGRDRPLSRNAFLLMAKAAADIGWLARPGSGGRAKGRMYRLTPAALAEIESRTDPERRKNLFWERTVGQRAAYGEGTTGAPPPDTV